MSNVWQDLHYWCRSPESVVMKFEPPGVFSVYRLDHNDEEVLWISSHSPNANQPGKHWWHFFERDGHDSEWVTELVRQ